MTYGTAAHVVEPQYFLAGEQYVDLGVFYDTGALEALRNEIIGLSMDYNELSQSACRLLDASVEVGTSLPDFGSAECMAELIKKRAKGIISREMKKTGRSDGKITVRFLSAFTWKGTVTRFDTVMTLARRVYTVDNELGFATSLMSVLAAAAVRNGYDVVICPAPPGLERIEHLIIPELSLAFVSQSKNEKYPGPVYRHLRLDALADKDRLREERGRIRAGKKLFSAMLDEARRLLMDANVKKLQLDGIYDADADFDGVCDLADDHAEVLLG